ncbi:MAG: GNAT family N-acetyltransferase [Calditrichaeota bacterium]|nr:GNAT family N-acetyltransferase [Calditrichota bacterium]
MTSDYQFQFLPWDSEFFGIRIGRIDLHRLTALFSEEIVAWQAAERLDCIYFLADSDDQTTARLAIKFGFDLVSIRVLLDIETKSILIKDEKYPDSIIRPAAALDLPVLLPIAARSYTDSRYYKDGRFAPAKCDELYVTWLRKSIVEDYADIVWTAEIDKLAAGFVACKIERQTMAGNIGLVGIGAAARGKGFGRRLIMASLEWFKKEGCRKVEVVTQGCNISAQRLYQSCGFRTRSVQLWYHRWLKNSDY